MMMNITKSSTITLMSNKIHIPQRMISYGEKVNLHRLQYLASIKDKRQTIKARKLAKLSTDTAPDNDV